jgi:uncharacterized protein YbjT (DUF2867 family)
MIIRSFPLLRRIALTFFLFITTLSVATIAASQTSAATDPAEHSAEPTNLASSQSILMFGATRGTGLELARLLTARGDSVTAFVRPTSDRSGLEPLGVEYIVGDAMVADDVKAAFAAGGYRAVVSTLGCFRCDVSPDYIGNKNVFDAAKTAGVGRVIMISSVGAGNSADATPWISKWFLKDILLLKTQAEDYLRNSGLVYTIIRPGALKDGEATGNGILTEDVTAMGIITRKDLAQLMLDALDDEAAAGKTYTARDSEMTWPWDMW